MDEQLYFTWSNARNHLSIPYMEFFCQQIGPPVLFVLSEIIREERTNEFDYLSMRQSHINISPDVIFLFITSKNMEFMIW